MCVGMVRDRSKVTCLCNKTPKQDSSASMEHACSKISSYISTYTATLVAAVCSILIDESCYEDIHAVTFDLSLAVLTRRAQFHVQQVTHS